MKGSTWKKGQSIAGQLPVRLLTGITSLEAPGAGGSADAGKDRELAFEGSGEQVFAVIYRKIRFKRFSSRKVGNMFLEPTNRWKSCWDWRGMDDGQDKSDENDLVEATLLDASNLDDEDEDESESEDEDEDESEDETEYPRMNPPAVDKASEPPVQTQIEEQAPTPPDTTATTNREPTKHTPSPETRQVQTPPAMSLGKKIEAVAFFFTLVWIIVYYMFPHLVGLIPWTAERG